MASYRGAHRSDLINEEDGTPNYDANKYYPAYIGELICNKYCLISKVSWGVNSTGPLGEHTCLVFELLREPLWLLGRYLRKVSVSPTVLKPFLKLLLQGLDFLYTECYTIHTTLVNRNKDLKLDNFLVGFETNSESHPSLYKMCAGCCLWELLADTTFFNRIDYRSGEFKFLDLIPAEDFTLLNLTLFLDGDDKYLFLNFVKRML
ncbi:kinase-like protein [Aspergillus fumigatus]